MEMKCIGKKEDKYNVRIHSKKKTKLEKENVSIFVYWKFGVKISVALEISEILIQKILQ